MDSTDSATTSPQASSPFDDLPGRVVEMDVRTQDMEINMGPQHPATHGVMRMVLKVDGEIITGVDPTLGYLHRCAEKIGESVDWLQYLPYTDRYDYLSSMNNNLGYSLAVEKIMAIDVPERAQWIRMICAELNRIASHLVMFGTYGIDMGAFTPFFYAFREREDILILFEKLCGARLTYSYLRIGGVYNDLPAGWCDEVLRFCDRFEKEKWQEYIDLLIENHIYINRTANVGIIPPDMAMAYGLTGPMLRGSGIDYDTRRDMPYLFYDKVEFDVPLGQGLKGTVGDCWDRVYCRMREMQESVRIVRQCIEQMSAGEVLVDLGKVVRAPSGEAYVGIENPRGELGHYIVASTSHDRGKTALRCRVRGPSYCNLSVTPALMPGAMLADAVAIIGSIDVVIGETDR